MGAGRGARPQRHQDGELRRRGEGLRGDPGAKQEWGKLRRIVILESYKIYKAKEFGTAESTMKGIAFVLKQEDFTFHDLPRWTSTPQLVKC